MGNQNPYVCRPDRERAIRILKNRLGAAYSYLTTAEREQEIAALLCRQTPNRSDR